MASESPPQPKAKPSPQTENVENQNVTELPTSSPPPTPPPPPPPPGIVSRLLAAVRRLAALGLLRRLRYLLEDSSYFIGRQIRKLTVPLRRAWVGLPIVMRRRIVAGLAVAAIVVVALRVLVPIAPCGFPGGEECAADDHAIELVDAGSTAYVHLSLNPDSRQFERAQQFAAALPTILTQVLGTLPTPSGAGTDIEREIAPWVGDEVAISVMRTGRSRLQTAYLFKVVDEEGALAYADKTVHGVTEKLGDRELQVGGGLAASLVDDFLVVGDEDVVRAALDVADGRSPSLADEDVVADVVDRLPEERMLSGYIAPDGAAEIPGRLKVGGRDLRVLANLLNPEASEGAAFAIGLGEDGRSIRFSVRGNLDSDSAERSPGFLGAFAPFEPKLPERIGAGSIVYLDVGNPSDEIASLLGQSVTARASLATAFRDFEAGLRKQGLNFRDDALPLVDSETAFVVEPRTPPGEDSSGGDSTKLVNPDSGPILSLISTGADGEGDREAVARLQGVIASRVDPNGGQAAGFEKIEVDGVDAEVVTYAPGKEVASAIFDGTFVLSTDRVGIERARQDGGLEQLDRYQEATDDFPDDLSLLAYVDLEQGIELASEFQFGDESAFAVLAPDLRRLDALAFGVTSTPDTLDSDLRVVVGGGD